MSRVTAAGYTARQPWSADARCSGPKRGRMTKHSRREREQRIAETERIKEIESAWVRSVPAETAAVFAAAVQAARERGPQPKPPDMAPGTPPRPPRPGREPRPPKEPARSRRSW
jgi:hypothetical protein